MDAMILSAGLGMRMRPLTEHTPKALLQVGSHRLIEYHLLNLASAGITDVVINTSYLSHMFNETLGDGSKYNVNIRYSHEGDAPLETGGGILKALHLIQSDPFLIVNADIWTDFSFNETKSLGDSDGRLVVTDNPQHNPRGDFVLNGELLELPGISNKAATLTYSGIALLRKALVEDAEESTFPLIQVFRKSISEGKLAGHYFSGIWQDIGTPERLRSLDQMLNKTGG